MRKVFAVLLVFMILVTCLNMSFGSAASVAIPSEIKVGIMYDDPLKYASLALKVKLKAVSGVRVAIGGKSLMTFGANIVVHVFNIEDIMTEITVKDPSGDPHTIVTPKSTISPSSSPRPTPNSDSSPSPSSTPTPGIMTQTSDAPQLGDTPQLSTASIKKVVTAGGYKVITSSKIIQLSGNYYININHLFPDLKSVQAYTSKLDSIGIFAFPLYMNAGWHVCLGGFATSDTATKVITRLQNENDWLKVIDLDIFNPETLSDKTALALKKDDGKLCMMVYIGDNLLDFESVKTDEATSLYIGTAYKEYRGKFEIFRKSQKSFTVINILSFEQYLYGVVPAEIGGSASTEALKAQAVASRTYAYNQMFPKSAHAASGFDICATVHCHVYKGKSVETAASNAAINATAGEMVYFKSAVAKVFYYSSNGGSTEDVKYVWGSTTYPYLISVKDKYETPTTTNYTWKKVITYQDVATSMTKKGYDLGTINDIRILEKTPAGRPFHIQVFGTKGLTNFYNESCRTFLSLPSQLYNIATDADTNVLGMSGKTSKYRLASLTIQSASGTAQFDISSKKVTIINGSGTIISVPTRPNSYTFEGRGWGHAIGMSQNGAMGMAKNGFKYDEILKHYFPGTTIN